MSARESEGERNNFFSSGVNEVSYSAICPTVSNYILYGEYHLLRCKVEKINNYTCTTAVALYCGMKHTIYSICM